MKVFIYAVFIVLLVSTMLQIDSYSKSKKMLHDATSTAIFIAYPRAKEDKKFFIFFNSKKIGSIDYGERMVYHFLSEGMLKLTISKENVYKEPATLSRSSRVINIAQGKEYYFEINGKGELEYIINTDKGKSRFSNEGSFVNAPKMLTENLSDSLIKN